MMQQELKTGCFGETQEAERTAEVVVPFTTPELTQYAIEETERLSRKLGVKVHVILFHQVPMALTLEQPPVSLDYLRAKVGKLVSRLPMRLEVCLVRDAKEAWRRALPSGSTVVLASKVRPWRTAEERMAQFCSSIGHEVVLVHKKRRVMFPLEVRSDA